MFHCPYCGTNVKEDEHYCIKCGKQLPDDMCSRIKGKKQFNKYWYIPLITAIIFLLSAGTHYFILQSKSNQAKVLYEQGEQFVLEKDYKNAKETFGKALKRKGNFNQAEIALNFMNRALKIESSLEDTNKLLEQQEYQKALSIINDAENEINNFNGDAASELIDTIVKKQNKVKIVKLNEELKQRPDIDSLKILLWDAEAINDEIAEEITLDIRNQIVEYFFSKASKQLNIKQFNDAQTLIEDGLKYAPDAEKLQSLNTTIGKEKVAFETAQQQRIELAMDTAAKEQQFNETDAIELVSVTSENDDQGKLVVKGEVKSVATIPLNSILIAYTLYNNNGNKILSNEVFVYPDKLYPKDTGKFEFTHLDKIEKGKHIDVKVNKITWYTD